MIVQVRTYLIGGLERSDNKNEKRRPLQAASILS
jgi:hypothetical protein